MIDMHDWPLRPVDPKRDFGRLAVWFTYLEDYVNTEAGLNKYYADEKDRILHEGAMNPQGDLAGFYWIERDRLVPDRSHFSLYVELEHRRKGMGSQLYQNMTERARDSGAKLLRVRVRDDCPEGLAFVERRGFQEQTHLMAMSLDLTKFDDRGYDENIERLKREGFRFTNMAELGNTEEMQRKLYALNDMTAAETMGSSGEHSWTSFEDFQKRVCQADWYIPAAQMVVIDSATGDWAAMSAITRFADTDYAYNLFTGVDKRYRGRHLGQAVKVLALRYARDVLKVDAVHTHHITKNVPILAIDRELGYVQIPGYYTMEKEIAPPA